ncbi:hypothetical protein CHL67_00090 [Prosthecochloris sp. GSB1]|nr:hypothetical protein CHL67_00090 [Prosthecochloris sp. GSB1]
MCCCGNALGFPPENLILKDSKNSDDIHVSRSLQSSRQFAMNAPRYTFAGKLLLIAFVFRP